jgi:hypothetical protein
MEDEGAEDESWVAVSDLFDMKCGLMDKTYLSRRNGENNSGDEDGGAHVDGCVLFVWKRLISLNDSL